MQTASNTPDLTLARLLFAIIISAVLHAAVLFLGHRSLFAAEGRGSIQVKVVTASLKNVDMPGLARHLARKNQPTELRTPPSTLAERTHSTQATSDRALSEGSPVRKLDASSIVRYFKGSELTQRPRPIEPVELSYPPTPDGDWSGVLVLRLLISETGSVDQVIVETADLPAVFQDEAVMRFTKARFDPGRINGVEVKSQMRVEVTFSAGG